MGPCVVLTHVFGRCGPNEFERNISSIGEEAFYFGLVFQGAHNAVGDRFPLLNHPFGKGQSEPMVFDGVNPSNTQQVDVIAMGVSWDRVKG